MLPIELADGDSAKVYFPYPGAADRLRAYYLAGNVVGRGALFELAPNPTKSQAIQSDGLRGLVSKLRMRQNVSPKSAFAQYRLTAPQSRRTLNLTCSSSIQTMMV